MNQRGSIDDDGDRHFFRSHACQLAAVALACAFIAAVNWRGDGLWFQGDSPRHAVNGLFFWDLVAARPRDPIEFAVRYYARYPVIAPATYPPLFYLLEGLGFAVFGPSPHVAKVLVLLFTVTLGAYATAWARRWQGAVAGWAGAFLVFIPSVVIWSNTIMLNVPAAALGLGVLYHVRRWLEDRRPADLLCASLLGVAVALTYYPGLIALLICVVWALTARRDLGIDRRALAIAALIAVALVPLVVSLILIPIHTVRQWPTLAYLASPATWTFYWTRLPDAVGWPALALGAIGSIAGVSDPRWRSEASYLLLWIATIVGVFTLLPAKDPRYVLLVAPAFVFLSAIAVRRVADRASSGAAHTSPRRQVVVLIVGLVVAAWPASRVVVPSVSGFRDVASYLRDAAPADAVLYDGGHDGTFGFYMRAFDPGFARRMVRADKLLFQFGPTTTFEWVETSKVSAVADVLRLLRTEAGCRWVAIEVSARPPTVLARRLLRDAVQQPDVELIRSFPIDGAGERRVDLYRLRGNVDADAAQELSFPAFSDRVFHGVRPIVR